MAPQPRPGFDQSKRPASAVSTLILFGPVPKCREFVHGIHAGFTRNFWARQSGQYGCPPTLISTARGRLRCWRAGWTKKPGLRAKILLNIQRRRGDTTTASDLVLRFTKRFWETDWPGSAKPLVFYDPRSLEPDGPAGVLHAKAVVADDETVFITSANLTEAALDRNFELGLLVRDRALALRRIQPLPGADRARPAMPIAWGVTSCEK